jgi:hypothetical protein
LRLTNAPPSLMTRSLRGIELAATETRHENPVSGLSGQFPAEDAYLVSLKLRDYPDCECWERGRCVTKTDVRAGATYLYDLKRNPQFVIDKPFHSIFLYLPRSALDDIARQAGAKRMGELTYQPGVAAALRRGNSSAPAKGSSPILAGSFRCSKSRPSSTFRSATFLARSASPPAFRRISGCFASACIQPSN